MPGLHRYERLKINCNFEIKTMKKLLFLLLFFLPSCEKERDVAVCWQCRWELTTPDFHTSTVTDFCYYTEAEIRDYEAKNNWINGDEENEMTCWRQGEPAIPPD